MPKKNIVIDGYNLLNVDTALRRLMAKDKALARAGLNRRLAAYAARARACIRIYYDRKGTPPPPTPSPVKEHYVEDADAAILGFLRETKRPGDFLVVSSDREVIARASQLGASIIRSGAFMSELLSKSGADSGAEKPAAESPERIREYLREFGEK